MVFFPFVVFMPQFVMQLFEMAVRLADVFGHIVVKHSCNFTMTENVQRSDNAANNGDGYHLLLYASFRS